MARECGGRLRDECVLVEGEVVCVVRHVSASGASAARKALLDGLRERRSPAEHLLDRDGRIGALVCGCVWPGVCGGCWTGACC